MAELAFDVVEQILVRLDVKDLIRCKSVCKSWRSLISDPRFVKSHLNHAYKSDRDNNKLGHRRICLSTIVNGWLYDNGDRIVGSRNGLVCVSVRGDKFLVTNPSTRELKKLPTPPLYMHNIAMQIGCWGFGYDAGADDYKVILGFRESLYSYPTGTTFYVLTLKSNIWKVIRKVKYESLWCRSGILRDGALHWLMTNENEKRVIISLDLSTEEFIEIPLPDAYDHDHILGVLEDGLCIYSMCSTLYSKKWVIKNNKWELYDHDRFRTKYDVAHYLPLTLDTQKMSSLEDIDDTRVHNSWEYIHASIFVKSLVSPHLHNNSI